MKKYFTTALLLSTVLATSFTFAFAQWTTVSDDVADQTEIECTSLTYNLSLGSRDAKTRGQVTTLQMFLSQAGYLESDPTGYFGAATKNAVKKFQSANGISALGGVGAYTRAKIKSISCSSSAVVSTPKAAVAIPATYAPTEVKVLNASGFASYSVSPNTASVKIGSFTLTSDKGAYLNNIEVFIGVSGYNISNITNLTIKSNGVVVGTPVGNALEATVFSFPALIIEKGSMKTFDVYADLGSGTGAVSIKASFSGTTGAGSSFSVLNDKFIPITTNNNEVSSSAGVSAKLVETSSPFSQSVNGGQEFFMATFNLRPKNTGAVKIKDLHFEIAGDDTIQTVTAYGKTAIAVGGKVSLYDINVLAPESGVDIPVSVRFNSVDSNFTTVLGYGATVTSSYTTSLILSKITATNNSGYVTESNVSASSNKMKVIFGNSNATTTPQKGSYRGYLNGSKTPFIATDNITKEEAYTNCKSNASNNPTSSIVCTWNGVEIYLLNPINKVSTVPTVEFLSAPTLKLQYDSQNKESVLVGVVRVKITAGNKMLSYPSFYTHPISLRNSSNSYTSTNSTKSSAVVNTILGEKYGDPLNLPANKSVILDYNITVPTKELFAGAYSLKASDFYYHDQDGVQASISEAQFIGKKSSENVSVIGETSSYITGSQVSQKDSSTYYIFGKRLSPSANAVTVNRITKTLPTDISGGILFSAKDFNITTSGTYNVQVSVNGQASNYFGVYITAAATATVLPIVEFLSTPTLKLQYDSQNKESVLTGEVKVKITTGASPFKLPVINGVPAVNVFDLVRSTTNTFSVNSGGLVTTSPPNFSGTIPANTSITFTVTYTAKPSNMFAGSYFMRPSSMYYIDQAENWQSLPETSFKNKSVSNTVTVVGESASIVAPTVEVLSTPTLKLQYDSANKESVIAGEVSVKITTGASAISLPTDSYGNPIAYVYGLANNSSNTFVGLNSGKFVTTTSSKNPVTIPANTSITFTTTYTAKPGDLFAGSYILRPTEMYYLDKNGVSNSVPLSSYKNLSLFKHNPVTVVGENAVAATITAFGNKDPNPTTGVTMILWNTSKLANVALDMVCTSSSINFTTTKGNSPTCIKGGVWTWLGQSSDSISIYPSGNTSPVTVKFTLTVLDQNGVYTSQKQSMDITFPATVIENYGNEGPGYDYNGGGDGGGGGGGASLIIKNSLSQVSKTILNAGQVAVSALSGATQASAAECVSINRNIHRGDESSTTKKLQEFLIAKGLLSEKATGFFGDLTIEAVKAYQRSLGVKETGMVYDVTRQAIMTETCQ